MNAHLMIKDIEIYIKKILVDETNFKINKLLQTGTSGPLYNDIYNYILGKSVLCDLNYYLAGELFEFFAADPTRNRHYVIGKIEDKIIKIMKMNEAFEPKEKLMDSKDKTLLRRTLDATLDDGKEIVIRNAAEQLSKTVVEPLATALIIALQLEDNDSTRGKIFKFLSSDFGTKLIGFAISFGIPMLPVPEIAKPYLLEIGRELRIQGEMAVAKPIVDMVAAPMRLLLTEKVMALPLPGLGLPVKQLSSSDSKKESKKRGRKSPPKKNNLNIKVSLKEELPIINIAPGVKN